MFSKPLVSICIPLYGTEGYLLRCLQSVAAQNFNRLEVIVVDDFSDGGKGRDIVRSFSKTVSFPVSYVRHEENKGLVEARRTAIYRAKGEYVLVLDSDDKMADNAVKNLYETAIEKNADIVQGKARAVYSDTVLTEIDLTQSEKYRLQVEEKINKVFLGDLQSKDILSGYLENSNHNGILWGKLIKKELYLEALEHIPPVFCTMAEDVVQYFWISLLAKKYCGIEEVVYEYSLNTGISSRTKIESLDRWEKVCSASSVFTAIYMELERLESEEGHAVLTEVQRACLNARCRFYLKNNLLQLKSAVIPELQKEAREMLSDYWGEGFVQKMEKEMIQ